MTCMKLVIPGAEGIQLSLVECPVTTTTPPGDSATGAKKMGLAIEVTAREFFQDYAQMFHMSDGSAMDPGAIGSEAGDAFMHSSFAYMQTLLSNIYVQTVPLVLPARRRRGASGAQGEEHLLAYPDRRAVGLASPSSSTPVPEPEDRITTLVVCQDRIVRALLLGVVGNFATNPSDPDLLSSSASAGAGGGGGGGAADSLATIVVDVYSGKLAFINPYNSIRSYFLETLLVLSLIGMAKLSLVRTVVVPAAANTDKEK